MSARPSLTTTSARSVTRLPETNRDGYVEQTVITSDGVRLAIREYGSARAADHTVVMLHGLCLTQESWAIQIRQLRRRWGSRVRIITYDHRGHGDSTGASMDTYRIDRLAADLAEVLTALRVRGPVTLAGHSMGGMTALAYLGRPAAERPVDPQGLVLVATAAGRLAQRGVGRLLGSPATDMVFDLVQRLPRRATDQVVKGLLLPVRHAMVNHVDQGGTEPSGITVAASAMRSISLATAVGFLPSLQRYDQYHMLASITAKTIVDQRRDRQDDPGRPRTRYCLRHPGCHPPAPPRRGAHAAPRGTTVRQRRPQLRDGRAPPIRTRGESLGAARLLADSAARSCRFLRSRRKPVATNRSAIQRLHYEVLDLGNGFLQRGDAPLVS